MWNIALQLLDLAGIAASGFMWGVLYQKNKNAKRVDKLLITAINGWEKTTADYEKLKAKVRSQLNWKI